MNQKKQQKQRVREAQQARQAKRVVNGIFIALTLLAVLSMIAYCLFV